MIRKITTAALVAAIGLTAAHADARGRWLKLRRQGIGAVIKAARAQQAPKLIYKRYERDVLEEAPDAGLVIEVSRRPTKRGTSDVSVVVWDGAKFVAALAMIKGKLTVRHGAEAPSEDPAALFRPVPALGVSLMLWCVIEALPRYQLKLEGEFQGTALFRVNPDYTTPKNWQPMKLGVSKQSLLPTVTEVVDVKSSPISRLLMMRPRERGALIVAEKLRLRSMKRKKPLDFALEAFEIGKSKRALFGARALSGKSPPR